MTGFLRAFGILFVSLAVSSAADLAGIWMGEAPGPKGEKQDVAFQFKMVKGQWTGVLFGDEFDLPVQDLHINGDRVSFFITSMNYYGGRRVKTAYAGTLAEKTLELSREQVDPPPAAAIVDKPKAPKAPLVLKRLAG